MESINEKATNFIEDFIEEDIENGVCNAVQTRFPPEPNGYLHIGHAKALCLNFSIAKKYGGKCNLRFDDTNPVKEDVEYIDAIKSDIKWLGFDWDKLRFGSDYFDVCYEKAVLLIKKGLAYVCDLSKDEMREFRGTLTVPGVNSPYRNRSVEENLGLFERMKNGEFENGSRCLRAKIAMDSPNINLRDPALYRILHIAHHQTGDKWCIYPMYDFAHPIQDACEGVTHSLCSLEYEAHRPLYDWVINSCEFEHKPRQIEFARLNMTDTVMSKRLLLKLVTEGLTDGWDDPRMPTLTAMRRRGYPAEAILDFLGRIGIAKADSTVDARMLEHCVRENLNETAERFMAVTNPLKVTITNMSDDFSEEVVIENLPVEGSKTHTATFSKHLYIERDDFSLCPPPKYFRLKVGGEVRLKGAYIIKCEEALTDENGNVTELICTYDKDTKSGSCERKVKGTIHWVNAEAAVPAEFRLFEQLFVGEVDTDDFEKSLNPDSLKVLCGFAEPALLSCKDDAHLQFMRVGYFVKDKSSVDGKLVYNRTVALKDSFKM